VAIPDAVKIIKHFLSEIVFLLVIIVWCSAQNQK